MIKYDSVICLTFTEFSENQGHIAVQKNETATLTFALSATYRTFTIHRYNGSSTVKIASWKQGDLNFIITRKSKYKVERRTEPHIIKLVIYTATVEDVGTYWVHANNSYVNATTIARSLVVYGESPYIPFPHTGVF